MGACDDRNRVGDLFFACRLPRLFAEASALLEEAGGQV